MCFILVVGIQQFMFWLKVWQMNVVIMLMKLMMVSYQMCQIIVKLNIRLKVLMIMFVLVLCGMWMLVYLVGFGQVLLCCLCFQKLFSLVMFGRVVKLQKVGGEEVFYFSVWVFYGLLVRLMVFLWLWIDMVIWMIWYRMLVLMMNVLQVVISSSGLQVGLMVFCRWWVMFMKFSMYIGMKVMQKLMNQYQNVYLFQNLLRWKLNIFGYQQVMLVNMLNIMLLMMMLWKCVIRNRLLCSMKLMVGIVSIMLVMLLMMKVIMKLMVYSIGVVKCMWLWNMVNSQLKIFMLVGIEMIIVVMLKKVLMLVFEFMVKKWCSYMMNDSMLMQVVVQIMFLQLNSVLCEKVVMILENILNVGRIRMYIFG